MRGGRRKGKGKNTGRWYKKEMEDGERKRRRVESDGGVFISAPGETFVNSI